MINLQRCCSQQSELRGENERERARKTDGARNPDDSRFCSEVPLMFMRRPGAGSSVAVASVRPCTIAKACSAGGGVYPVTHSKSTLWRGGNGYGRNKRQATSA